MRSNERKYRNFRQIRSFWPMLTLMDAAVLSDLIGRAQRREPAAFDELVELYASRLYGYFYRLTGSREDAEDLLQELFVRVVRTIEQYEHDGRFEGWIFRIATNLVRDRVRRARKSKALGVDHPAGGDLADRAGLANLADAGMPQPEHRLDRAEQVDRLQWALTQLGESERQVILLRHFSQLSFREIAEQMGTPLGTALARAHRGLAHLRELMEDG
jgi:RNA polymerase sigma-70 factor (ECF subfamily)